MKADPIPDLIHRQDWQWKAWTLNTPFKKGGDNVLKISERENAKAMSSAYRMMA